ncbi:MAG: hypothetical protein ACFCVD_17665 [Nodosilinea sp.]
MSDLDLIRQLADRLGRPLQELSEARFERHAQARAARDWNSQELLKRDAYALVADGSVSGLLLQPVTSEILVDFPFAQLSHIGEVVRRQISLNTH